VLRKALLLLAILLAAAAAALTVLARRTPELLVAALERGLGKEVTLSGIRWAFPATFEVRELVIAERGAFAGEVSLAVQNARIEVHPAAAFGGRLVLSEIRIDKPQIFIRKLRGRVAHALSAEAAPGGPAAPREAGPARPRKAGKAPALVIGRLSVRGGTLQWIDYDIAREGFVVELGKIDADVRNLAFGAGDARTTYEIAGEITQGRERGPAPVRASGWTRVGSLETDANLTAENLWIPYFAPYAGRVTASRIEDGFLSVQSTTLIRDRDLTSNARLVAKDLVFGATEPGNELFGYDAAAILDILRNQAGHITLDIVVRWDMKDPSATFESVLRRSISHSLKATFFSNIQNVVEKALDKAVEGDLDAAGGDLKDLFRQIRRGVESSTAQ
jgi:uncharacterized protein involved in outer membrane biogenesis